MPVFGLCTDRRVGSYVKPSAIIKATNPVDRILGQANTRVKIRKKHFVSPRSSPIGADRKDPYIVIAAYGTQLTLHNSLETNGTKGKLAESHPNGASLRTVGNPLRITVPTENSRPNLTAMSFIDITDGERQRQIGKPKEAASDMRGNTCTLSSDCSSEDYIDRTSLVIPLGLSKDNTIQSKNKPAWRRTAWDNVPRTKETSASITSFVDFREFEDSTKLDDALCMKANNYVEKPSNHGLGERVNISKSPNSRPNANFEQRSGVETISVNGSSFESILRYHIAKRNENCSGTSEGIHHQIGNNKIREVWSSRNKNEVSSRIEFTHEKLLRPRSAYSAYENVRDKAPGEENHRLGRKCLPAKKRAKCRRPRSANFSKSENKTAWHNRNSNLSDKDAYTNTVDAKSLIRQNHRPTTAIVYSKPGTCVIPSITPCIRKARVSHKTLECTYQRVSEASGTKTQNMRTLNSLKGDHSLNISVSVSKLSKSQTEIVKPSEDAQILSTKPVNTLTSVHSREHARPEDDTSSSNQNRRSNDFSSVEKGDACEENVTINETRGSCCEGEITSDCEIMTDVASSCPESGDHNHTTEEVNEHHRHGVKIRPLYAEHVTKFNGCQVNETEETSQKNIMIRQWLKGIKTTQLKNHD